MIWPLDLPARQVLTLPGETTIPWAEFDPDWYRQTYPDIADDIAASGPAALLDYYLEIGQRQGHAPNRFFDEQWHRRKYPAIANRIEAGDYASAFDAYCRRGCMDRSPHWLFDELGYRDRYPDLTQDVLADSGLANCYHHYLRYGADEDRIGHVLFDPAVYLANFDETDIPAVRAQGVFTHYLMRLDHNRPELRTSYYFDPEWYRRRYPEVAAAIAAGQWKSALHHYLCNDTPTEFDPLPHFSEAHYLARDPGLLPHIQARHFRNGYTHFLGFGARELRPPTPAINLRWYAAQPRVRIDLEQGAAPNAFAHWLTIGQREGLPAADPVVQEAATRRPLGVFHHTATALLPIAGRFGYTFECPDDPVVSVVMVVRDGFAATMATIASLRENIPGSVDLVIVDCGSTDETRAITDYAPGARLLRFDTDIGWTQAANAASQFAAAPHILFLDNQVRLAPGAVARACARLASDPAIGAVGGLVIQPHGVIAQAGGIIWNDGATQDYQRGESPICPEANFVRNVDYCSTAFLLVRARLLSTLGGFEQDFAATRNHGVDLCLRIIESGSRVVYDPSIVLFHEDEHKRPGPPPDAFLRRHADALATRPVRSGPAQVFARHAGTPPPRVLFIEDTIPLRRIGSGFVRANDLVRVLAGLGYQVTVFPVNGCTHDPAHVFGDMPDLAEVMHDRSADRFKEFLTTRIGYYDVIWIARAHNLDRLYPVLSKHLGPGAPRPLVVLDTEAVAPLRQAEQARLRDQPFDLDAAAQSAFANADFCDALVAVTEPEAAFLKARDFGPVTVVGHMIEPRPTPRTFAQRAGMLFVGAIHTNDSPNLDSLVWFVDHVLPLIDDALGWETRLTVAGYIAPGIDLGRFERHPRITLRGPVSNLEPLYNASRIFVAPTRYAAGTPYKVLEAASRGVPVVATDLLQNQLGWTPEEEILSAPLDPQAFAAAVIALQQQEELWRVIRDGALRRIRRDNERSGFIDALGRVLTTRPSEHRLIKSNASSQ